MGEENKQEQIIFDEFLHEQMNHGHDRGQRLNPDDIIDPSFPKDFLARANSQINHYSLTENDNSSYYIALTTSGNIEAFSFLKENICFIAISMGAITALRILFYRILSDPQSFPEVGNVEAEIPLTEPYLTSLPKNINELPTEPRVPICPRREGFSKVLTITAFHFLVAHELSHLSNGHLTWMNLLLKGSMISEVTGNNCTPLSCITRQTLEMDADASAVRKVTGSIIQSPERLAAVTKGMNSDSLHVHQAAYGTPEKSIYMFIYATTVFFRIFDEAYWDKSTLSKRSHPPSPFRNIWVGSTLQELLKHNKYNNLAEKVTEVGATAYADAVKALSRLTNEPPNIDGLMGAISDEYSYYPTSLLNHWGKIRKQLEPLSKGAQLAPVQS